MNRQFGRQAFDVRRAAVGGLLVRATAGCANASPESLAWQAPQQRECAATIGVSCPQQAG